MNVKLWIKDVAWLMLRLISRQARLYYKWKRNCKTFFRWFSFLTQEKTQGRKWLDHELGSHIKGPPAFILTLAPLSTSELWPSETNWASVNKAACRDLAALTETAGLGQSAGIVQRRERLDPAVPLKTGASLTRRALEEVQSISGADAEVGPLPLAS